MTPDPSELAGPPEPRGDTYWAAYLNDPPEISRYLGGGVVLDIGCGNGQQVLRLQQEGFRAYGLEIDPELAARCRARGIATIRGMAEWLPFGTGSCDGVLCKVVIPYTDERIAFREIARILAPGGIAIVYLHGFGYFLRYLLRPVSWRHTLYSFRSILNTLVYRISGHRLPGFLGDTIYQSVGRLHRYYQREGLRVEADVSSRGFLGRPVFIGHVLRR